MDSWAPCINPATWDYWKFRSHRIPLGIRRSLISPSLTRLVADEKLSFSSGCRTVLANGTAGLILLNPRRAEMQSKALRHYQDLVAAG